MNWKTRLDRPASAHTPDHPAAHGGTCMYGHPPSARGVDLGDLDRFTLPAHVHRVINAGDG